MNTYTERVTTTEGTDGNGNRVVRAKIAGRSLSVQQPVGPFGDGRAEHAQAVECIIAGKLRGTVETIEHAGENGRARRGHVFVVTYTA